MVCGTLLSLVPRHKLRHATRAFGFVVFRCRSYQCKKLGTSIVLFVCGTSLSLVPRHKLRHATRARFFISVSTFAQAQVKRYGFVVFRYRSYQCKKLGTSIVLLVCGTLLSLVPRHKLRHAKRARCLWYFTIVHTNAKNSAHALCRFINKNRHFCVAKSAFVYKKCECILHSHNFLVVVTGLEPMAS